MTDDAHERIELTVPLDGVAGFAPGLVMAATLHLPPAPRLDGRTPILLLLPGAGYSRHYFDIRHPDHPGYSEAAFHAANGVIAIAIDHLGVGGSSLPPGGQLMFAPDAPPAGAPSLTIASMAAACAATVRTIMSGLRGGTLDPRLPAIAAPLAIGIGQSMGGFVVAVAQAEHGCFDGIALLGSSMTLTDLAMKPGHRRPFRALGADARLAAIQAGMDMAASFHWPDEPEALVRADMDFGNPAPWRALAIPAAAGSLTEPLVIAGHAARVRVPVLLAYGESDVTIEPLADLAVFRSTYDLSLLLVPGMAHMHNFATTRARLWRRLEAWAAMIEPLD